MKSLKYIWLTAIVLLSVGFASCDKDDEYFDDKYQGRKIVIEKVFLEDVESSVPDREVTLRASRPDDPPSKATGSWA